METNEMFNDIAKEINAAAPPFDPLHALAALKNTNVYLFRYFPKLKMIVLTERLCNNFSLKPVYYNMPYSFADDFVHEDFRLGFEKIYRDIDGGAPSASMSFKGKNKAIWCHVTLNTVEWDSEHMPEVCTGIVEDRTKEEMINEELHSILSSISCGILQYRKSDNKLLRANKAALDILGYDTIEDLAANMENGVALSVIPEDRRYINGLVTEMQAPGEIQTFEYRVKHNDYAQLRYCYGTVQIYDNIHGERVVQRTIMDITDRKLREDIQQTNSDLINRLDTVMGGISGGLEITLDDAYCTYMFVNENVAALQGYTVEELLRVCDSKALHNIHPQDREKVSEAMRRVNDDNPTYHIIYRLIHRDGHTVWVSENGKRVCGGDGVYMFYSLIQDITESQKREAELSKLLTMQRQMMTSLSCGVLAYTLPERNILIANKEIQQMFNYDNTVQKPLIHRIFDVITDEDRAEISAAVKELKAVGDSCSYNLHPLTENGTRLVLKCSTKLRAFDDGQKFILSVLTDMTEIEERTKELNEMNIRQKDMLSEIRKERQQYRDALVSGSEYSYRFDATDGIVQSDFDYSVRGSLEDNLGITAPVSFDSLVQRWFTVMRPQFLTPDEQNPMTCAQVRACYERGLKHIVSEYYNQTENKYYRRTFLLSVDEDTNHLCGIAIVNDITGMMREETRKRNELAMINRDLNNQINISKAFSSIYFASWEVNLETETMAEITVPDWTDDIHAVCRNEFKVAADMLIDSFVKEESRDAMRQFVRTDNMAQRLKDESIISCEYQGVHYGWSTACLIPYMRDENGNVLRVIFAVREISNEKRIELEAKQALEDAYEAANRANAAKTDFLSSVSHDIRTPMNGIIGMTAIAGTHLDDKERVADCLAKISISSKHLLGLINEVLDMNKIESGKLDLNLEEFLLSDLIDTLLVMSKPQLEAKGHKFSVNIHNVEHERVVGDSLRLQQVFVNLLSNAIKYTPDGGTIKLTFSEKATNNPKIGCYEFTIEDNGIGMSKEYQEKLFEPFSRAKDQRVAKIQGSGLGMAIARNIVRMMNGDIQVESELSKGSKFTVTVYLELQNDDGNASYNEFIDLPILVADDDEASCESTCLVLKELGMNGEWVLTGAEAIRKTIEHHNADNDYFAVILDWKMPEMDGVTTAREIRKAVGDDIPIIIISAYDWSDIEQEARTAGVSAFISKPIFKSRIAYLFKNLIENEPDASSGTSTVQELSTKNFKGRRALLAEDNELNAEIAQELLGMTGLDIDHVMNGKEAVDIIANSPKGYYDVIFMDIQMPIMNGYEATRAIRSMPGSYEKSIPIIAMTANAFADDVQAAKSAGMNEHIAKPLNIPQLVKALEHWLG